MTTQRLTFDDAVQLWIKRWLGLEKHTIIREAGQNPLRVYEVWEEKTFKGSRMTAMTLFARDYPAKVANTDFSPHMRRRQLVSRPHSHDEQPGLL